MGMALPHRFVSSVILCESLIRWCVASVSVNSLLPRLAVVHGEDLRKAADMPGCGGSAGIREKDETEDVELRDQPPLMWLIWLRRCARSWRRRAWLWRWRAVRRAAPPTWIMVGRAAAPCITGGTL